MSTFGNLLLGSSISLRLGCACGSAISLGKGPGGADAKGVFGRGLSVCHQVALRL